MTAPLIDPMAKQVSEHAPLTRLSASRVTTALSCGLKAHRRYVQRLDEKTGLQAFRGTMLHQALEETRGSGEQLVERVRAAWAFNAPPPWRELFNTWQDLREQMADALDELDTLAAQIKADAEAGLRKGGAQAPRMTRDFKTREERLLRPWRDTIDALNAEEHALLISDRSPWQPIKPSSWDPSRHSAFRLAETSVDTARAYATWWQALPDEERPEVIAVEASFKVEVDEFLLNGAIDRIDFDPATEKVIVTDYKTGRGFDKQERFIQSAFYAIGAERLTGMRPSHIRFLNLDQGPAVDTYPVHPGWDEQLLRLCRHAKLVLAGLDVPSFHGCGFCSFAPLCFDPSRGVTPFTPLEDLKLLEVSA